MESMLLSAQLVPTGENRTQGPLPAEIMLLTTQGRTYDPPLKGNVTQEAGRGNSLPQGAFFFLNQHCTMELNLVLCLSPIPQHSSILCIYSAKQLSKQPPSPSLLLQPGTSPMTRVRCYQIKGCIHRERSRFGEVTKAQRDLASSLSSGGVQSSRNS